MRYYKRIDAEGNTTTVESYSHDLAIEGAIEITQAEYNSFIASLPPVTEPDPNPDVVRASELLSTSSDVITQPEMWELMRIFGRLLHIP